VCRICTLIRWQLALLAEEATLREMVAAKCMLLGDANISVETALSINTLERGGHVITTDRYAEWKLAGVAA